MGNCCGNEANRDPVNTTHNRNDSRINPQIDEVKDLGDDSFRICAYNIRHARNDSDNGSYWYQWYPNRLNLQAPLISGSKPDIFGTQVNHIFV